MPVLEYDLDVPGPPAPVGATRRWIDQPLSRWVLVALVLSLSGLAAMLTWPAVDHRPVHDREAIEVVMNFVDAANAHDWTAMEAQLAPGAESTFLDVHGLVDGPYTGKVWEAAAKAIFDGFHLTVLSEPIVARGSQVSMVLHMTRVGDDRIDLTIFDLVRVDGRLKIQANVIMATPKPPGTP